MKLKSILVMALVAIMAIAGGAFAANTITTTTTGQDGADGANFAFVPGVNWATLTAVTAADATANGTGIANGMPAGFTYGQTNAGTQYDSVLAQSGYDLNAALFGMCSSAGCAKFVPGQSATGWVDSIGVTQPTGSDAFNQGSFYTGLVSGFNGTGTGTDAGGAMSALSQQTTHSAYTGAGTDGDYVEQRLATAVNMAAATIGQNMNQEFLAAAGSNNTDAVTAGMNGMVDDGFGNPIIDVTSGALDPNWLLNVDETNTAGNLDGGLIVRQTVTDVTAGQVGGIDIGSYGQAFMNSNNGAVAVATMPTGATGPAAGYLPANVPGSIGIISGVIP